MRRARFKPEAVKQLLDDPEFSQSLYRAEVASRDCAFAYLWSPFEESEAPLYSFLDTVIYAGVDDESRTAHVTFRGTDSLVDWVRNAIILPVPLLQPAGHLGFLLTWKLAQRRVLGWLRENAGRYDSIVVSGHSLGGALATCCAYEVAKRGLPLMRCVTFGGPRVYWLSGHGRARRLIGERMVRVEGRGDRVHTVPPRWMGFRHVGDAWQNPDDWYNDPSIEGLPVLGRLLDRVLPVLNFGGLPGWVDSRLGDGVFNLILLAALAGLGAVAAPFVAAYMVLGAAAMLLFLLYAIAGAAATTVLVHNAGKYAGTRHAESALVELSRIRLREIALAQEGAAEENADGTLSIPVQASFRVLPPERRAGFVAAVNEAFDSRIVQSVFARARLTHREELELQGIGADYHRAVMFLYLIGYEPDELDSLFADGAKRLKRPRNWRRYYAYGPMSRREGILR